jgi:purine-binding chemotaxis protein CheW
MPDHDRTCIVVAQVAATAGGTRPYGVIVDGVEEVAQFTAADIEPPPDFGGAVDSRFITGMAKAASGVKVLVDLDLISAAETATLDIPASEKPSVAS